MQALTAGYQPQPLALTVLLHMALLNVLVIHPATTEDGFSPEGEDLSVNSSVVVMASTE